MIRKIKDGRVDRIVSTGNIVAESVYYSPISILVLSILMLFIAAFPLGLMFVFSINYAVLMVYFMCAYLACAYLNNSFVLTHDSLVVVNPNFPFKQCKSYPFDAINQITIDELKLNWCYLFGVLGSNYVRVQTQQTSKVYFCVGLELDSYDENWIDNTIDKFNHELKQKGVDVVFKLDKG